MLWHLMKIKLLNSFLKSSSCFLLLLSFLGEFNGSVEEQEGSTSDVETEWKCVGGGSVRGEKRAIIWQLCYDDL